MNLRRNAWKWGLAIVATAALNAILLLLSPTTSIVHAYRPSVGVIRSTERIELREYKRRPRPANRNTAEFTANGAGVRSVFITGIGKSHAGDSVWILYDSTRPSNHIIYSPSEGAMIFPEGANIQHVRLDDDEVRAFFDSVERARSGPIK